MAITERGMAEAYLKTLEKRHKALIEEIKVLEAHMLECAQVLGMVKDESSN